MCEDTASTNGTTERTSSQTRARGAPLQQNAGGGGEKVGNEMNEVTPRDDDEEAKGREAGRSLTAE